MIINSTSISQLYVSSQTSQVSNTNQDTNQAADTPQVSGSHHHHHHSGGGGLMKAVQQALNQMGLNLDSQSSSSSQTATGTGTTDSTASAVGNSSSTTENTQQALHAFMHDLFGALRATQDQANGTVGTVNSQTGDNSTMSTQLQDVIQALGSSDTSSLQNGPLSNLQPDFSNLVSSLGAGSSINGTETPDVQVFLQNLLQDQVNGTSDNGNSQFGSIQSGYPSDLTSQLQNVIQALGNDTTSNQSGDLNKLQSDFSSLISSLGGGNSGNTSQSQDLQVFLQNLLQNLPGQQTFSPSVGSFVSTTV